MWEKAKGLWLLETEGKADQGSRRRSVGKVV